MINMHINEFQIQAVSLLEQCFGKAIPLDKIERNYRFFEEATELVQACGMTKEDCLKLIDYVYGRPIGEVNQEIGGVLTTLAGLAHANHTNLGYCALTELEEFKKRIVQIREKWQRKEIKHSPLP